MENESLVLNELSDIKKGIEAIKEHLADITLSGDDVLAVEDYKKEKKEGKLLSEKEVKKELGI